MKVNEINRFVRGYKQAIKDSLNQINEWLIDEKTC